MARRRRFCPETALSGCGGTTLDDGNELDGAWVCAIGGGPPATPKESVQKLTTGVGTATRTALAEQEEPIQSSDSE